MIALLIVFLTALLCGVVIALLVYRYDLSVRGAFIAGIITMAAVITGMCLGLVIPQEWILMLVGG